MNRFFTTRSLPGSVVLTALITFLAGFYAFVFPSVPSFLCALAMKLSSIGDCILNGWKPLTKFIHHDRFVCGGMAFCVSHLVYGAAFAITAGSADVRSFIPGYIFAASLWLITCAVLFLLARKHAGDCTMWALMSAYLGVETLTTLATSCSAAAALGGGLYFSALGGLLFFFSDVAIALDRACNLRTSDHNDTIIWVLYPAGQLLLLIGA